jgi:hypothetical protein
MRASPCPPTIASTRDRGGIVVGWLTKLTVVLALIGIMLFDAISIGTTNANVADQASQAAFMASSTWDQTRDLQATYEAAVSSALEQDPQNVVSTKGFSIDPDGTVHLVMSRDAKTLVLYRWSKTKSWAHVTRAAQGRSVG